MTAIARESFVREAAPAQGPAEPDLARWVCEAGNLSRRSEAPVQLRSAAGSAQADAGQLRRAFALA